MGPEEGDELPTPRPSREEGKKGVLAEGPAHVRGEECGTQHSWSAVAGGMAGAKRDNRQGPVTFTELLFTGAQTSLSQT